LEKGGSSEEADGIEEFRNDPSGASDVTLSVDVQGGAGQINLEVI
jgi:hypothetical protein